VVNPFPPHAAINTMELQLSSWVCMGIILLQLLARFADADARVGGSSDQSSCPCLGLDEVPPLSEADQAKAIAMGLNTSEYGIGCGAHDKLSSPCTAAGHESLWCRDEFCYVDNLNCDVPLRRSKYFPDSARYFSYETCGFVDQFYRDPKRLDGAVLLGAMEENYRGYQGSRIDDGTYDGFGVILRHDNVSFYGTTIDLVNMLVNESGIGVSMNQRCISILLDGISKINFFPSKLPVRPAENQLHSCSRGSPRTIPNVPFFRQG
jgi:hypothetical protein